MSGRPDLDRRGAVRLLVRFKLDLGRPAGNALRPGRPRKVPSDGEWDCLVET